MDSLELDVRSWYESRNVEIVPDGDQYSTDFSKCLKYLNNRIRQAHDVVDYNGRARAPSSKTGAFDVVVISGLGGRVDQAFSQFHYLYQASADIDLELGDIFLVSPTAISFLLQKGMNIIRTPVSTGHFTENVGIIPLGRPAVISTKGLEWDVKDWPTEFGTQMSTSNHIKEPVVKVETSERVLFTVELAQCRYGKLS